MNLEKAFNNLILEVINEVYVHSNPDETHKNVLKLLEKHGKQFRGTKAESNV